MGYETTREEASRSGDLSRGAYWRPAERDLPAGHPFVNNRMSETNQDCIQRGLVVRLRAFLGLAVLSLFVSGLLIAGCARPQGESQTSQADREAILRRIAFEYAQDQDLARAQASLGKLGLANPAQILVTLAEQDINQGRTRGEVEPLARLADSLGARSPALVAFLEPKPTATLIPPSPTPVPPSPTAAPTSTPAPPSPTVAATPPASTATATATQRSRVLAQNTANLRSGPGKAYPLVGRLASGESAEIIARNASGDWWQLARSGQSPAWVAGTTVKVQGPIDTVAVAENVPPPPPPPTAGPPTAPPPTQAPPKAAGPDFRLVSRRLFTVEENGGGHDGPTPLCGYNHTLYLTVLDAAGNPLNGVTIRDANGTEEHVSGDKGPGKLEFALWFPGIDVVVVRDADGRQVTSDVARNMKVDTGAISDDELTGAGYCTAGCAPFRLNNGCTGHYSWDVTFQRAY
jgi:uncharacterized protein YraI